MTNTSRAWPLAAAVLPLASAALLLAARAEANCRHDGDDWVECHDLTLAQLRDTDNKRDGQKLISLDVSDGPRYAAVWIKDSGARQVKQFDVSWDDVLDLIEKYKERFAPVLLTTADGKRFGVVLEKMRANYAWHWKTSAKEFDAENDTQRAAGRKLVWVKAFDEPAQFLGIWHEQRSSDALAPTGWSWEWDANYGDHDKAVEAYKAGHLRPALNVLSPDGHIGTVFYDFPLGRWTEGIYTGNGQLEANIEDFRANGQIPLMVQAAKVAGLGTRYGVIAAGKSQVMGDPERRWTGLPRRFRVDPPHDGSAGADLDKIDDRLHDFMSKTGARSASVAVVKGHKLQFARAYTFAEDDYPTATRDTEFRLASCGKTLTALLALRTMQSDPKLNLQSGVLAKLGWPDTAHAADGGKMEIQHLLTHTSGLEHDEGGDMGADLAIQKGLEARDPENKKVSLPLSTALGMRYGLYFDTLDQPEFTPGADESYSNFAYSLLGFLLDRYKGGNGDGDQYRAAMREMLGAIGALSGHIHHIESKDLPADKLPDSLARPHMDRPRLATTVLDNSGDLVLKQFGGQNWQRGYGAHGYNASAPGLVRVLGTLLSSVSQANRPVNAATYDTLLRQVEGAKHYTLAGFRLPEDGPTYISKSGGEVGTACLTFFPYGDGAVDAAGCTLDSRHRCTDSDGATPPKAQFGDIAAVILADTDAGSLSQVGDQLYWLFVAANSHESWPNHDLFKDGWIVPFKQ